MCSASQLHLLTSHSLLKKAPLKAPLPYPRVRSTVVEGLNARQTGVSHSCRALIPPSDYRPALPPVSVAVGYTPASPSCPCHAPTENGLLLVRFGGCGVTTCGRDWRRGGRQAVPGVSDTRSAFHSLFTVRWLLFQVAGASDVQTPPRIPLQCRVALM